MKHVVLVNEKDEELGSMEKLQAHQLGRLHRAFSVFIFNSEGRLLIQKRAVGKYHSGGLWTNTCCSHPELGENVKEAAQKRLISEMGINCMLEFLFTECYELIVGNGLIEHEFDHVFFGISDDLPNFDPEEVETFNYISEEELALAMLQLPEEFTEWFKLIWSKVFDVFRQRKMGYIN